MRSAKILPIQSDPNFHFVEYCEMVDLERVEPDTQISFGTFVSWLVLGACSWVCVIELIRAIIRWPYWAWIIR